MIESDLPAVEKITYDTMEKKLGYLRWFLNWATDRGYNTNLDYKKFHPTLKMTQRKVIYLTKEEIARVRDLELS
ncbi:MAG: site-specific integrase, partial [Candidatus Cryptobacteroides sp.]|nr:site-specific integrase [Candidatus Cryptobacteroides sp.]